MTMELPTSDARSLGERDYDYRVQAEANMLCVEIRNFVLPSGYNQSTVTLLVRLSPGFPDIPPDMWWFDPPVGRSDGKAIPATDVTEHHVSRTWQRWSRHLRDGQWKSGTDSLESYLALIRRELEKCALDDCA
ncbi:MAG: hypothetical protein J0M16_00880 [Gammaproteobacteria bacterium]|nr:hypothetical protein [Gammaproteobacteria bacterium]